MSWAEVKKINSDMTTPLDELFKNSFVLTATTNPITDAWTSSNNWHTYKVNYSGVINVHINLTQNNAWDNNIYGRLHLKINDGDITTLTPTLKFYKYEASNHYYFYDDYIPIAVNAGDKISVIYGNSYGGEGSVCLCASVSIGGLAAEQV